MCWQTTPLMAAADSGHIWAARTFSRGEGRFPKGHLGYPVHHPGVMDDSDDHNSALKQQ